MGGEPGRADEGVLWCAFFDRSLFPLHDRVHSQYPCLYERRFYISHINTPESVGPYLRAGHEANPRRKLSDDN